MPTVGEDLVEAIMWYLEGRNSKLPPALAAKTEDEREALWKSAKKLVDSKGEDYALAVVAEVVNRKR